MLADKLKFGLIFVAVAAIMSCSKKEIPEGTRISVLPVEKSAEKEIAAGEEKISLPATKHNLNWSQNGGNTEHSYGNLYGEFPLEFVWQKDFGASAGKRDMLISEPVVFENTIFTVDANAKVSAFRLENGDLLWEAKVLSHKDKKSKSSLKASGLAANAGKLFVTTGNGEVVALNVKDGKEFWRYDAQTPIRIAPTASSGKVFVQTIDNKLIAINAANGQEVWNYEVMQEDTTLLGGASPAFDNNQDILIAAFSSGELQAIKASTGSPLWSGVLVSNRYVAAQSSIMAIKANPVIEGERVYAIGNSKTLAAINSVTGERIWDKPISGSYQPIVSGKYLFVLSNNNYLSALRKSDGYTIWSIKLDLGENNGLYALRPLLIDGYLLVTISDGRIFKVDVTDGKIYDIFDLREDFSIAPIIADGNLIFTTSNAKFMIYR